MTIQEIEQLISFIERLRLEEVHIETDQVKLHIKRSSTATSPIPTNTIGTPMIEKPLITLASPTLPTSSQPLPTPSQGLPEDNYTTIKSPMIGTFYRSSSPNKPPLVEEGTTVQVGQPLCVIEAMKLFNEIETEAAGMIIKILVEDASPVEYDQPLFLIKPT
jgi:acetyl-CoA carboxylase biotin carboxyl carrier protein